MTNNNIIRFERAMVHFADGLSVDGYRMPSGELTRQVLHGKCYTASVYGEQWIIQLLTRGGWALESLRGLGFTGSQITGIVAKRSEGVRGASQISITAPSTFGVIAIASPP